MPRHSRWAQVGPMAATGHRTVSITVPSERLKYVASHTTASNFLLSIITALVSSSLRTAGWAGATLAAPQNDSYDILVVDDDPFIRTTVSEVLADAGYAVG